MLAPLWRWTSLIDRNEELKNNHVPVTGKKRESEEFFIDVIPGTYTFNNISHGEERHRAAK